MDSFLFKLNNIFEYEGFNCIFSTFKEETLQFLNDKNLKLVDYKSIGSLFGMNYVQDSIQRVDILIEFDYDFYILKNVIRDLIDFYCTRKILTKKTYEEIIENYALDKQDLCKSITKLNERKKFKLLQRKIWVPLYNAIKTYKLKNKSNSNYNLNISKEIDNNNNNSSIINNNSSIINNLEIAINKEMNKLVEDVVSEEEWTSINKKKKIINF